jgi:transposase
VAYNFHPVDRNQELLLPVNMKEWLGRDHFVHFVVDLVDQLDLAEFLAAYRLDGKGRAAYDPAMMVALFIYAYCDGERSSRRIEEHCRTDAAYRLVTGGLVPDHSTIARFRDKHEKAFAAVFVPVLGICLQAGLGDTSLAAVDGSKFRCPASLRANRTRVSIVQEITRLTDEIEAELARITAEILAESRRADLADDTLDGTPPPPREPGTLPDVVGLPRKLHGKAARRARLARARDALDDDYRAECADHDQRMAERAAKEAATGKKTPGPKPQPPARDPDKKVNVTDPESRIMKDAHGGYLQGYNAQSGVAADRVNLAAEVVDDENDTQLLHPMMETAGANLAAAGPDKAVELYLADSGYCTEAALAAVDPAGPRVLTATGKEHKARRRAAGDGANEGPPPAGLTPREKMDWELGTAEGKAAYPRRAATVEPVFGQHKHNRGFTRFLRTGLSAVNAEWKLMNATDNISRLFRRTCSGDAVPAWAHLAHLLEAPQAT